MITLDKIFHASLVLKDIVRETKIRSTKGIAEESRTIIAEQSPFWSKFSLVAWNT